MQKNIYNIYWNKVVCLISIIIILTGILFSAFSHISLKQYEKYSIYENVFDKKTNSLLNTQYSIKIFDENILEYRIILSEESVFNGIGTLKIYKDNNLLGEVNSNVKKNKIIFCVKDILLEKGENYIFQISMQGDKPFSYYIDNECRLKDEQIYRFGHQQVLRNGIIAIFLCSIFLIFFSNRIKDIGIVFMVLSLTMGIIFCFINPPFCIADEFRHTIRAYSYAVGDWKITNYIKGAPYYDIPEGLSDIRTIEQISDFGYKDGEYNRTINLTALNQCWGKDFGQNNVTVSALGVAPLSPIGYLPQSLFIKIALYLHLSPLACIYLARIGNILVYSFGIGACIRKWKRCQNLIAAICLIPLSVRYAASNSTDGVLLTLVIATLTYLMQFFESANEKNTLYTTKHFLILSVLTMCIANIKLPYIALLLTLLALDKSYFKGKWINKIIFITGILFSGIISYRIMQIIIDGKIVPSLKYHIVIENFLENPISVINILVDGFYQSYTYITNSSGIGHLDVIYILFLFICACCSIGSVNICKYQKWVMWFVGIFTWCSVIGVAWIWGLGIEVRGMHGRYIFTILPFILIPLAQGKEIEQEKKLNKYCQWFEILIISSYAIDIIKRHYIA